MAEQCNSNNPGALPNSSRSFDGNVSTAILAQQQMLLLLHADRCLHSERDEVMPCGESSLMPNCSTIDDVLRHIISCTSGFACTCSDKVGGETGQALESTDASLEPSCSGTGGKSSSTDDSSNDDLFGDPLPSPGSSAMSPRVSAKVARVDLTNGDSWGNLPQPEAPSVQKEWHQEVTKEQRGLMITKLVKAMFPWYMSTAGDDPRLIDLISTAKKDEKEIFEAANDKDEYRRLLSEKIDKIDDGDFERKNQDDKISGTKGVVRRPLIPTIPVIRCPVFPLNSAGKCDSNKPATSSSTSRSDADEERIRLIQQQLVLLLHADKCGQRDRNGVKGPFSEWDLPNRQCNLPHCSTMKTVLHHMKSCTRFLACTYPHCASSREIIGHWKHCPQIECSICSPLRAVEQRDPTDRKEGSSGSESTTRPSGPVSEQINHRPASVGTAGASLQPSSADSDKKLSAPGPATNSLSTEGRSIDNSGSSSNSPGTASPSSTKEKNSKLSDEDSSGRLPQPEPTSSTKTWHQEVTVTHRGQQITKLVKVIFPGFIPAAHLNDPKHAALIALATKDEKRMFESSNDKEEYDRSVAEKVAKIHKDIEEKKRQRFGVPRTQPGTKASSTTTPKQTPASSSVPKPPNPPVAQTSNDVPSGSGTVVGSRVAFETSGFTFLEPIAPAVTKEWHRQVTKNQRNRMASMFVMAMNPPPGPPIVRRRRSEDMILYSKMLEAEAFEAANSMQDYLHLLAFKRHKILNDEYESRKRSHD